MSRSRPGRPPSELQMWLWLVVLLTTAAGVWAFATPLFTGPDEVSQARRAAAVVRGEITGRQDRPGPPLLVTVEVPVLYGDPAEKNFLCHAGPLLDGAPQESMALPSPPCPDLHAVSRSPGGGGTVEAETVQYRGQPFFYALVGLPTLIDEHVVGARAMRMVGVSITAALLASAFRTVSVSRRRPLAAVGLLVCITPGVLYLAGSTNPSAVEIAAALSAWAAIAVLATADASTVDDQIIGRSVRRLGTALVVLTLSRGLGPAFTLAVLAVGTSAAGLGLVRTLLARRDVRVWGVSVAVALVVSGGWLAYISREYPLPGRAGSGFVTALGWLPWYLHQSVGVFGTNDSGVAPTAAALWWTGAALVTGIGVALMMADASTGDGADASGTPGPTSRRMAVLSLITLGGGLLVNVTAEGLSLPPIGFFWQGRYALPLLLGGVVLATTCSGCAAPAGPTTSSGRSRSNRFLLGGRVPIMALLTVSVAVVLLAIHLHGLWEVTAHHGSPTGALRGTAMTIYATALVGSAGVALAPLRRSRAGVEPGRRRWPSSRSSRGNR